MPSLICVEQDYTGKAKELALAYACGIGAGRAGILETTFRRRPRPTCLASRLCCAVACAS